jgi:hypothetical protein
MSADAIASLKITLDDVEPMVLRRIEVPLAIRLDRLHLVIQAAMGWTDSHLYEIRAGDVGWGIPDPDWGDGPLDARKTRLVDVLEDIGVKTMRYLYDFGDGWEHTIKVERIGPAEPDTTYPRLIEATGRCPPEDVGGPPGYEEFTEAIADPQHERHAEMREWCGEDFDPNALDNEGHANALATLARQWARKHPVKRKKTTAPLS